jgi:hypothetical protein
VRLVALRADQRIAVLAEERAHVAHFVKQSKPSRHGIAAPQSAPASTTFVQRFVGQRRPAPQSASLAQESRSTPAEQRLLMQRRPIAHSYGDTQPLPRPRTGAHFEPPGCEPSQK